MYIAVDFDGTCVANNFPTPNVEIGADVFLRKLIDSGYRIILNTMRSDKVTEDGRNPLGEALEWFKNHGIRLYGINVNPDQISWTWSPKVNADIYIDDKAIGCPLVIDQEISDSPFVNWPVVMDAIEAMRVIYDKG